MICTLTGVDDFTPIAELFHLSRMYPFVEWGVLYSETEAGNGRYPSLQYLDELCQKIESQESSTKARFALHVCGRAVHKLMDGSLPQAKNFGRIQVNFISRNFSEAQKLALFDHYPDKQIITQHNEANRDLVDLFSGQPRHSFLFDSSGGRGLSPDAWPEPIPNAACGYAGGLGPDNLHEELPRIMRACGGKPAWIDMESKLRNAHDMFDLGSAVLALEIVDASGLS